MGKDPINAKADQALKVMKMKPLLNSQIGISAQVWVCDACGGTDHKSCSCRATAHSEELKKKKEQDRQRAKAYRDRAASRDADIENTKESGNGHGNGRSGEPKLNAVGKPYSESYDPNYKMRHRVALAPIPSQSASQPERFERKDTAKFTRLLDGLISADLPHDLLGELKAHGATFLVEALEDRLSPGRNEKIEEKDKADEITPEHMRTAFILKADAVAKMAEYSGRATGRVYEAARDAANAWNRLADDLQRRITPPRIEPAK